MSNDKKENSQLLLELIGLSISILMLVGVSTYYFFANNHFIEWLIMMIGLLGVLISGIITMMGVVLTLNRTINRDEKKEKQRVKKLSLIVYSEVKAYAESIKKYNLDSVNLKLGKKIINNSNFENKLNKFNFKHELYFILPNIREMFYEIIEYNYDEEILQIFIILYNCQQKAKQIYDKSENVENIELLKCTSLNWLSGVFYEYEKEVIDGFNENNINITDEYWNDLIKKFNCFRNDDIFSFELNKLLSYLKYMSNILV